MTGNVNSSHLQSLLKTRFMITIPIVFPLPFSSRIIRTRRTSFLPWHRNSRIIYHRTPSFIRDKSALRNLISRDSTNPRGYLNLVLYHRSQRRIHRPYCSLSFRMMYQRLLKRLTLMQPIKCRFAFRRGKLAREWVGMQLRKGWKPRKMISIKKPDDHPHIHKTLPVLNL